MKRTRKAVLGILAAVTLLSGCGMVLGPRSGAVLTANACDEDERGAISWRKESTSTLSCLGNMF